jgi:hypothetical protein
MPPEEFTPALAREIIGLNEIKDEINLTCMALRPEMNRG